MIPIKGKPYQDHTFSLSIFHLSLMMTILFTSRWNSFLIALACWRHANYSPIFLWERLFFGHIFIYQWSPWGWQASSIWSLLDAHLELALHFFIRQNISTIIRRVLTPLGSISSFFIMLMSWRCTLELTPSLSSRHTCHRINSLMTILHITPWIALWSTLDLLHFILLY